MPPKRLAFVGLVIAIGLAAAAFAVHVTLTHHQSRLHNGSLVSPTPYVIFLVVVLHGLFIMAANTIWNTASHMVYPWLITRDEQTARAHEDRVRRAVAQELGPQAIGRRFALAAQRDVRFWGLLNLWRPAVWHVLLDLHPHGAITKRAFGHQKAVHIVGEVSAIVAFPSESTHASMARIARHTAPNVPLSFMRTATS